MAGKKEAKAPTKAALRGTTAEEKVPMPADQDPSVDKRKEFWKRAGAPPKEG